MRILFLGETYRADAITWIKGIEMASGKKLETKELIQNGSRTKRMLEAVKFFVSLALSRERYDITLAERSTSYGFFSLFVNTKVRIVAQQGISDVWPDHGFAGWYKSRLQKAIYRRADLIHAWGNVMTYAMLRSGASPSRIMVKPKGLDLGNFSFTKKGTSNEFTAIVTRSLFPIYHHADILEAISILLSQKGIIVNCLMVGDGIEMDNLQTKTKALGLENQIEWLGRIDNQDLPKYLERAELYLAVPETEGVSASLFEAMACGCFPIVTDLPANRAFISPNSNGMLVPINDPEALAGKIEKAIINWNKYQRGIRKNRIYIERNCDLEVNMKDFFERYKGLLEAK